MLSAGPASRLSSLGVAKLCCHVNRAHQTTPESDITARPSTESSTRLQARMPARHIMLGSLPKRFDRPRSPFSEPPEVQPTRIVAAEHGGLGRSA